MSPIASPMIGGRPFRPHPAGQVSREIADSSRLGAVFAPVDTSALGAAVPVTPQTFSIFTGIADPRPDDLGMDCAGFAAAPQDAALRSIEAYYLGRGASKPAIDGMAVQIRTGLYPRMLYDCRIAQLIDALHAAGAALQNAVNQRDSRIATLQSQLGLAQQTAASKDAQIAGLQDTVNQKTAQLDALAQPGALPQAVQDHLAELQHALAEAQNAAAKITAPGVIVGTIVGFISKAAMDKFGKK